MADLGFSVLHHYGAQRAKERQEELQQTRDNILSRLQALTAVQQNNIIETWKAAYNACRVTHGCFYDAECSARSDGHNYTLAFNDKNILQSMIDKVVGYVYDDPIISLRNVIELYVILKKTYTFLYQFYHDQYSPQFRNMVLTITAQNIRTMEDTLSRFETENLQAAHAVDAPVAQLVAEIAIPGAQPAAAQAAIAPRPVMR